MNETKKVVGGAVAAGAAGGVAVVATQGVVAASIPAIMSSTATVVAGVGSFMSPIVPVAQGVAGASLGTAAAPAAIGCALLYAGGYFGYRAYKR